MHDPLPVHHRERRGGLPADAEGLLERQAPAEEALGEVLAVQPLHHQELLPLIGDAVIDVADEPGVLELGERQRLPLEAGVRGGAFPVEEHLHRAELAGLEIAGAEDLAHPPHPGERADLEPILDQVPGPHIRGQPSDGSRRRSSAIVKARPVSAHGVVTA